MIAGLVRVSAIFSRCFDEFFERKKDRFSISMIRYPLGEPRGETRVVQHSDTALT